MIKINLNPHERKKVKFTLPEIKLEKIGGAVYFIPPVLLITAAISFGFYQNKVVNSLKEEKAKLVIEKNKYKAVERKIKNLNKKYSNLKNLLYQIDLKKSIYKEFSKQKVNFNFYFKIAYSSIPDGVWLSSLYISRAKFEFKGYSLNPIKISEFYNNLNSYFDSIVFKSVERKSNKLNSFYDFSFITTGLKKEGL